MLVLALGKLDLDTLKVKLMVLIKLQKGVHFLYLPI